MGLLDDAIREHLDLKRRRGADPAEIERAERDALGPVRRGPEGEEEADLDRPAVAEDDADYDYDYEDEPVAEPEAHEDPRRASVGHGDYGSAADNELEEPWDPDEEPFDDDEPANRSAAHPTSDAHDPAPAPDQAPPAGSVAPGQPSEETAEFEVGLEDELGVEGEDVLEGTPEFLQDTPDHDRLWFEQRPPKDFDFDE